MMQVYEPVRLGSCSHPPAERHLLDHRRQRLGDWAEGAVPATGWHRRHLVNDLGSPEGRPIGHRTKTGRRTFRSARGEIVESSGRVDAWGWRCIRSAYGRHDPRLGSAPASTADGGSRSTPSSMLAPSVSLSPKLRVTTAQTQNMPFYLRTFFRVLSSWVHGEKSRSFRGAIAECFAPLRSSLSRPRLGHRPRVRPLGAVGRGILGEWELFAASAG